MAVNPVVAVGVGAGVATALGVGFGVTKITDAIAEKHPNGSSADGPAAAWSLGTGFLGVLTTGLGVFASARANPMVGAGLIGAGSGMMVGAVASGIAFTVRHGVGVDTLRDSLVSKYDHNWNGQLELDGSFWRQPETIRTERREWEDSDGDTHVDYDLYTIDALANTADANRDRIATRAELRDTIKRYDENGDDRLQGAEARRFDRELGERQIY